MSDLIEFQIVWLDWRGVPLDLDHNPRCERIDDALMEAGRAVVDGVEPLGAYGFYVTARTPKLAERGRVA